MKREELEGLTDEQKDLVMRLYGKSINQKDKDLESLQKKLDNANEKINTYETKLSEYDKDSKENADWKAKYDELNKSIAEQEAKRKAEEEEELLTNNILESIGDKQFTSDYAKNGVINDIKTELNKPENKGKGIKDIFEDVTKDKEGIFASPNKLADMQPMGDSETENQKDIPTFW